MRSILGAMTDAGMMVFLTSRLLAAGITAFLAIILWSKTRDLAWMLIVIGVVSSYAEVVFDLLVRLGLIQEADLRFWGIPAARILFSNLPYLFLSISFLVMIAHKRGR